MLQFQKYILICGFIRGGACQHIIPRRPEGHIRPGGVDTDHGKCPCVCGGKCLVILVLVIHVFIVLRKPDALIGTLAKL